VVLFPPLHVGRPLGFACCPGGLGFAPVRARCGDSAAAWVAGVLAAPGQPIVIYFCWTVLILLIGVYVYVYIQSHFLLLL